MDQLQQRLLVLELTQLPHLRSPLQMQQVLPSIQLLPTQQVHLLSLKKP
jgi:hypothetical protein